MGRQQTESNGDENRKKCTSQAQQEDVSISFKLIVGDVEVGNDKRDSQVRKDVFDNARAPKQCPRKPMAIVEVGDLAWRIWPEVAAEVAEDEDGKRNQGVKLCIDARVVGDVLGRKHAVDRVRWCVEGAEGPCFGVLEYCDDTQEELKREIL